MGVWRTLRTSWRVGARAGAGGGESACRGTGREAGAVCVSDVGVERGWGWGDAPGMRREGGEGRPFLDAGVRWGTVRGLRLL